MIEQEERISPKVVNDALRDLLRSYTIQHQYLVIEPLYFHQKAVFRITPERGDYRKIVGRRGRKIKALKFIFERAVAEHLGYAIEIELKEASVDLREKTSLETVRSGCDKNALFEMLRNLFALLCDEKTEIRGYLKENIYTIEAGLARSDYDTHRQTGIFEALDVLVRDIGTKHGENFYLDFCVRET